MVKVELKRPLKLSDLEEGKIFDSVELIIRSDESSMETVGWQEGIGGGREYDMRIFRYDFKIDGEGNVLSINNNGYGEIFSNHADYNTYKKKLIEKNLLPEN